MEEQGIVIAKQNDSVLVKVEGGGGCQSCHCKGFCAAMGDGSVQIMAENRLEAQVGDMVTVMLGEGKRIAGSALIFLTPLLGMFVGLFLGSSKGNTGAGILGAVIGVVVGVGAIWVLDRWLGKGSTFRPRVTSIQKKISQVSP
jgi:positive regulator of sigma E activity